MLTPSSSLFLMTRLHPSVALIAHLSGQVAAYAFTSPDGRYQAAEIGGDTVIVDLRERRQQRACTTALLPLKQCRQRKRQRRRACRRHQQRWGHRKSPP
ncbi:hypothetical protein VAPA_1c46830 [Variovorax paradoxus B4]|uniref:Uncharacterized protein n=1 Tax=Variovorax paradoxus B4 TaxID=1246301 RepID=T1XHY4_VARPD|nr:hypothetical protein VAPA_1c46830 [Variovorax paradoxus B4]